jgi:hypothetical protein
VVPADEVRELMVRSSDKGLLLVFGVVGARREAELPPFEPDGECTERAIVRKAIELAFPTHTEALRRWFATR